MWTACVQRERTMGLLSERAGVSESDIAAWITASQESSERKQVLLPSMPSVN